MQGNRVTRIRSAHPHHRTQTDPHQQGPVEDRARQGPSSRSPFSGAAEALPASRRAALRRGRQQPHPNRAVTGQQNGAQDSRLREQLLAHIEDLARELKCRWPAMSRWPKSKPPPRPAGLRCCGGMTPHPREACLRRDGAIKQELMMKTFPERKEGSIK